MHKIVVAITGASGAIYARILLEKLLEMRTRWDEVCIVASPNARTVWEAEGVPGSIDDFPFRQFDLQDFTAPFASGSGGFDTMIIIPCSMGTLGRIASGVSNDLVTRAADVLLKERKKLICVARETPYNLIHIRNMETITLAGGVICPATPSFYSQPKTIEEAAATVVDRVLQLAGLDPKTFRWGYTGQEE